MVTVNTFRRHAFNGSSTNTTTDILPMAETVFSFPPLKDSMSEGPFANADVEVSTTDKPIPSKRDVPEPAYIPEMTITYETTTENLKDSVENENQTENSNFSNSNKNLYYGGKSSTEYGVTTDSLDIIDGIAKSTQSKTVTLEKVSTPSFRDAVVEEILASGTTVFNGNSTTINEVNGNVTLKNTRTESSIQEKGNITQETPTDDQKSIGSDFIGKKEIEIFDPNVNTETLILNLDEKQTQRFTIPQTLFEASLSSHYGEENFNIPHKNEEQVKNLKEFVNVLEGQIKYIETHSDAAIITSDQVTSHINDYGDYSVVSLLADATETNNNSTRNPKKIQGDEENEEHYPEGRIRPIHPDPGYGNYPEIDIVRPYRPDSPIQKYSYFRPTPDYRTPEIREDKNYTRPPTPDPEYQRISFRPIYNSSKQEDGKSLKPISVFATSPQPYRPSFNRPSYHPPSSFGRPYRPDYHRPASKPVDDFSVTKKFEIKGGSTQDADVSEHSRADFDYTRFSENSPTYTKIYNSEPRPSAFKPDFAKPYKPTFDGEISMLSKGTSEDDTVSETHEGVKAPKPDMHTNRPSSFYPRPGFGTNYQSSSDTSLRPFSVGTVTSAKNLTRVECKYNALKCYSKIFTCTIQVFNFHN